MYTSCDINVSAYLMATVYCNYYTVLNYISIILRYYNVLYYAIPYYSGRHRTVLLYCIHCIQYWLLLCNVNILSILLNPPIIYYLTCFIPTGVVGVSYSILYAVLYCIILHYTVLQYIILLFYALLYYSIQYLTILYWALLYYSTPWCTIICYSVFNYTISAVLLQWLFNFTTFYCTVLYYAISMLFYTLYLLFYTVLFHTVFIICPKLELVCVFCEIKVDFKK